jgi:hypothetical protein
MCAVFVLMLGGVGHKMMTKFCIQMMCLKTWQTMESLIPVSTANWHLSNMCPLPAVSFLTEAALLGQCIILHNDYTQQQHHHHPNKRPPSTTQQLSTVTNCCHMLPADYASPLFWSKSTALFQLWKHVLGHYHTRCLICGFLTRSLLPYRFDTDNIYLEHGFKQLLWNCSVHFTPLLPQVFTQPMYTAIEGKKKHCVL